MCLLLNLKHVDGDKSLVLEPKRFFQGWLLLSNSNNNSFKAFSFFVLPYHSGRRTISMSLNYYSMTLNFSDDHDRITSDSVIINYNTIDYFTNVTN